MGLLKKSLAGELRQCRGRARGNGVITLSSEEMVLKMDVTALDIVEQRGGDSEP
jgi:hypothetical protein